MIKEKEVVRVKWVDSCSSNTNWTLTCELDGDVQPIQIITFGILVSQSEDYITVAQNYGIDPEQFCNFMTIPRGCIKKLEVIEKIKTSES